VRITEKLFGIESKVAAIFGATPIGEATASLFREMGARVDLVPTISDPSLADKDRAALDPADEAAVASRLDKIVSDHGRLDMLVYVATGAQWDRIHGINMRGAFVTMREAVRRMIPTGGGRIVALSTIGSLHPVLYGNTAYGSSKAGLNALVRNIAFDHAKDGILANCILHGGVNVGPLPSDSPPVSGPATQPGRMMLGSGNLEELAAGILYLASPAGRFITGQKLTLDGGFLIS
jgi:NAD(P)-dependent dehydrogenase (short-subunit alcohol dehydrogenase family)